ncbi:MAG TPA: 4-hydroxyphenylacetate 3-hydroxylase N-terminal domain-containing protein [Candidatus Competibacteraceae bacterium]|nr:4-hydroxyphenylacetate 3-hydroxylase N-terminal domain-containing protein [Candidatus Competibacteraceae bacterium]HRZ05141.1 4-hydroxyphenylacetate 3-hydroxylase N-terminal domain-containing protein [Candidatus Competibacteraceae bacterium]
MLMSGQDYRESLRRYQPRVFINGRQVESVVDEPLLAPGVNGVALTYDFALCEDHAPLMRASRSDFASGQPVNRMIAIPASTDDLLDKLEAVRLVCQETGCAQRYLGGDALSAIQQTTVQMDAELNTHYSERFRTYLEQVYAEDLTLGVAMTDGKGDRSRRPSQQANPDAYVQIVERRKDGIVISGVKAIITGAPYMHELLVMPGRNLTEADADYAVCCAVPVDAENLTLVARPAGRPGEPAAKFSARYGQSTAVAMFDQVFVPWERVFLAGEWRHSGELTHQYATHHRHTCIGARAGFGDLLIGAGALMTEANGLDFDHTGHLREAMVELIQITEGFFACGVAASVYGVADPAGVMMPEPVFANIGKLLLATQIYDMHRLAHTVSGGLIVTLPGPDEDHNPATAGRLSELLAGRSDIPYEKRIEVARFIEDLTASYQAGWYSVISLHGGGSPEAMKREIWRQYPVADQVALVERLLDRGVLADPSRPMSRRRQPGRCCALGCEAPAISPSMPTSP